MGDGARVSNFTKNPFYSGGGEVQLVNLFLQRIQICKSRGGGGGGELEYVIFFKRIQILKKCGWG